MDVYPAAESDVGLTLEARTGGSPFNVAIAAARLGVPVAYLGSISGDVFGERLLRTLQAEDIDTRTVQRCTAPTTLSVVGVDRNGQPSYAFHGERGADRELSLETLARVPPSVRALHVGSYAMIVEPIATTLRTLVDRKHRDWLIAWDPNVRPGIVANPSRWRDLAAWMLPRTHLLKLSREDLAWLAPSATPEAFAADALARGVRLVLVTDGANGASAWHAGGSAQVGAADVRVVDTVGAGDAFQGALLAWLAGRDLLSVPGVTRQLPFEAQLRFATAAAAATCSHRGAHFARRSEVEETR
jgi:fructokinase